MKSIQFLLIIYKYISYAIVVFLKIIASLFFCSEILNLSGKVQAVKTKVQRQRSNNVQRSHKRN